MGRLIKRPGRDRWVGIYRDAQGRRRQKALSTHKDVSHRMLRELERDAELESVGLGVLSGRDDPLEPIRERYLDAMSVRLSPSTLGGVRPSLRDVIEAGEFLTVGDVTTESLDAAQIALSKRGLANSTVNLKMKRFLALLRWAKKNGIVHTVASPPTPLPVNGRHAKRPRHRLTIDECRKLVAAAREHDASQPYGMPRAPLIELLIGTGFRIGEACRLVWSDLAHTGRTWTLTVRAANVKTGRPRTNPITDELVSTLEEWRRVQIAFKGRLLRHDEPIVGTYTGRPATSDSARSTLRAWLNKVREKAGLPAVYPDRSVIDFHALRHTYCCLLAEQGVNIEIAAELMGHSNIAMTRNVYLDVGRIPKDVAADVLPAMRCATVAPDKTDPEVDEA